MAKKEIPLKIPGENDWIGYESDLDVKYAHRLMYGKSNEEILHLFGGTQSIDRADELLFMPRRAFQYYIFAFAQYLMSSEAKGNSDAASPFLRLLIAREERDPSSVSMIYRKLQPIVDYVATHQEWFDADPDIYGSFLELGTRLHELCEVT
ncbi:hypothetical protein [Luteimonas panaciterrae]|uniref:hypothetical protein n=1 Tax=Luteimonas panaciterrae TaxID=363885 RepID=UPI001CFB24E9|nr:hypothetical protein [Luteimonas panaciterrae]